ncbi:MAG: Gfo/Idh/MocA family protein, partial [Solirubrobacteraceae bacterium]
VVGLGPMGRSHLRVLDSFADAGVSVVAVVDPDESRRDDVLRGRGECRGYDSLAAAAGAESLDFACIATPVQILSQTAAAALKAGLHVLVEKPMAADLAQARELLALAERIPQILMVGLVERCNPAVRALKEKLAEQHAGRIMQLTARRLGPFPNRGASAGVALDLAVHDVDVMRYLTNCEVKWVYAEAASIGQAEDDLLCATLRFDDDVIGLLETNWVTPVKVRQLSVTCERGMFVVDYLSQDLTFYEHPVKATVWDLLQGLRGGGEGDMIRYAIERWEPLRLEWEAFFAATRTGAAVPATARDAYEALAVAHAIHESGRDHAAVSPAGHRQPVG